MTISDKLKRFGRSLYSAPLNYPLSFQLKNLPQNIFVRAVKAMIYSFLEKGYEVVTNERIVEIPFVFQNLDLSQKSTILDFGCCESMVSIELASLGHNVTGVDMNEYIYEHPNFNFIKMNFLNNMFHDEYFDAIIAISAIEHCGLPAYGLQEFSDGDHMVINEMHRILRKDGKIALTVPFGKKGLIEGHLGQRIYDYDSLMTLLSKFKIIKEAYFIGIDKKYWLPSTKADLRDLNSASKGFAQGVACIYASK